MLLRCDEKLFGLDDSMSNEQKCKELRKQYSKWSGLTASSDKSKRDQANKMVEKIAKLPKASIVKKLINIFFIFIL